MKSQNDEEKTKILHEGNLRIPYISEPEKSIVTKTNSGEEQISEQKVESHENNENLIEDEPVPKLKFKNSSVKNKNKKRNYKYSSKMEKINETVLS